MDIYINETVSSPPPSTKTSQEATTYFTIPPKTTPTAEPTKSKNFSKKWMYALGSIVVLATAGIAIASFIIALSSNELNKEMKTKLEKIESQARSNEEFQKFWQATSKNCYELANLGVQTSGVYNITAGKKIIEVYCDMETDGGGWMVIQRRVSNVTDFYREFSFYKVGFGILSGNFWLGLDNIHTIASSGSYQLRVDLLDFSNKQIYALYSSFSVGNESSNYTLHVSGYSGNATEPTTTIATTTTSTTVGGATYLGCYIDEAVRDLDKISILSNDMDINKCVQFCKDYRFAGLQYSVECYCGNSVGKYNKGREFDCNMNCGGNNDKICGGIWRNSVYKLQNAGDSLTYHNNQPFSTKDRDNDANSGNCAVQYHGAWWYRSCYHSNLNGKYYSSGVNDDKGIKWNQWISQSLKRVEMKIKPN